MRVVKVPHGDEFVKLRLLVCRARHDKLDGDTPDDMVADHFIRQEYSAKGTVAKQLLKAILALNSLPLKNLPMLGIHAAL